MNEVLVLLRLIRVAMGKENEGLPIEKAEWPDLTELAMRQGVDAIACDGLQRLYEHGLFLGPMDLELMGCMIDQEGLYARQEKVLRQLAKFYDKHGIRTMVIKGWGLSMDYPIPAHRYCCDLDIYLFGEAKKGNELIRERLKTEIDDSHHNHSVFTVNEVTIENHYNFVNVYSHWSSRKVDQWLKEEAKNAVENDGIWLPSAQFNALYLLRHTACHFAAQEITLRNVLDWAVFVERHYKEVDWSKHMQQCKELNMHQFLWAINYICVNYLGFSKEMFPTECSQELGDRVLSEILQPEYQGRTEKGFMKYIASRYRKWWANRWKHRMVYSESLTATFFQQALAHVLKPASLISR